MNLESLQSKVGIPDPWFNQWLIATDWTIDQLARGELPEGIKDFQHYQFSAICYYPDLWAYSFLKDPDHPEKPWEFWDYQKESFLYDGPSLFQCGAEVGKTREIIAYILYKAFTTPHGSGLVAAPQLTHLIEILDALEWQLEQNPVFKGFLVKHRKHPHHQMRFANRFSVDFRPTGHDGTSLRGVHVKTFALFEEAAKAHNRKIWDEFWRALLPHCVPRIYSTPDGLRDTVYYRLTQIAAGKDPDKEEEQEKIDINFRLFKWSKRLMPKPFWSKEREKWYIKLYKGKDSPGFRHNVEGEHGDPENSVFPWDQFKKCIAQIEQYRHITIIVNNETDTVSVTKQSYGFDTEKTHFSEEYSLKQISFSSVITDLVDPISGVLMAGGDFGHSNDPTEILVKQVIGKIHKLILRISMRGCGYDQQAVVMDTLDTIYSTGNLSLAWGMDVGNAGSALMHVLQSDEENSPYRNKKYEEKIQGYQFSQVYDAFDEQGEVILDAKTEKPVRKSAKEIATDLLTTKIQRCEMLYPPDPEIMSDYPGHTYREGTKGRIYKKENDHIIDSDRSGILARVMSQELWDCFI